MSYAQIIFLLICIIMLIPFIFNFCKVLIRYFRSKYFFKGEIRARYKDKTLIIRKDGKIEVIDND